MKRKASMNKSIRLATVFSGVGAIEHALHRMEIPFHTVFACDNGERTIDLSDSEIESTLKALSPTQSQELAKQEYAKTKKPNYMKEATSQTIKLMNLSGTRTYASLMAHHIKIK
ncbi:MAG: hypothetical protein MZU97_20770 [Bacillus subtilis]|nr:hypothetical protein [Bacillus subtilis]